MKKLVITVLVIVVLGAGGYFGYSFYQRRQQAAVAAASAYETATISTDKLVSTISAIGKVRSAQSATLAWETSGTVESVPVAIGDKVKAGQMLANLVQTSLPQSAIMAQADLVTAQQNLEGLTQSAEISRIQAMQNIVTFEQAVRDAQYTLDNFNVPVDQQNMTAVEALQATKEKLDAARAAFEPYKFASSSDSTRQNLKDALDQAQSDYNAAIKRLKYEYDLEVAQANLDKANSDYKKWANGPDPADVQAAKARIAAAQATLSQISVTAPFSGTITQVDPLPGDQVSPNKAAFHIDDLTALYVDLDVSEIDVNMIQIGQEVAISFDALRGQQFHGNVTQVAMLSSSTSDVVNFTVTIKLTDANNQVRPGMTSQVDMNIVLSQSALLVPTQAVRLENGKQVVYVMRNGQAAPVEVTLGMSSDKYSEVLSGLQAGDTVVLNPPQAVQTGNARFLFGGPRDRGGQGGAQGGGAGGNTGGGQP